MRIKTKSISLLKSRLLWPVLVYFLLSALAYWPVQPLSSTHVVTCGCYDIAEQAWFLAWTPHAILNGMNPFFTHALNYPYGANLASNTTMPLLSILVSPITLLLGPISSFNLLIRLAFALSATSMFFVLRRYVKYDALCFIGGLLYGFSPYMIAQSALHLNLAFVALFPPIIVALDNLFIRQTNTPRRDGLVLGLLVTAQYFISSELVADLVLLCAIAVVILAVFNPRKAKERFFYSLYGIFWSAVPLVLIAGYPIVFSFKGPEHVAGSAYSSGTMSAFHTDLLSPIVPTSHQLIGSATSKRTANLFVGGSKSENGAYVGIPLILVTGFILAYLRKNRAIRYLGTMAVVSFIISLGPQLYLDNTDQNIALPFTFLEKIKTLSLEVVSRYMLFAYLCLAILLTVGLAEIYEKVRGHLEKKTPLVPAGKLKASLLVSIIAVLALVPLLPALPYKEAKINIPKYFFTSQVNKIPSGSTVLTYPYPVITTNYAMMWQIQSGFRFNLLGGYVFTPFLPTTPNAKITGGGFGPVIFEGGTVPVVLFEQAYAGPPKSGPNVIPPLPWAFAQLKTYLAAYHVNVIIAARVGKDPGYATVFLSKALEMKPEHFGNVDIWFNVGRSPLLK